jgi:hypothetical protein
MSEWLNSRMILPCLPNCFHYHCTSHNWHVMHVSVRRTMRTDDDVECNDTAGLAERACRQRSASFGLGKTMSLSGALNFTDDGYPGLVEASDSSWCDSDCSSSTLGETNRSCRVQFSKVSIREYSLTVGDTRAAKLFPLSLDWAYSKTEILDITLFEEMFSSATTKPKRNTIRGFRIPHHLSPAKRLKRLASVTGQSPESLYELEFARWERESKIRGEMCSSDDGYVEDPTRITPYEIVDVDEYQMAEL